MNNFTDLEKPIDRSKMLKLCQYNIYFGSHPGINICDRTSNVCQCILEQDADVVCLQEVLYSMYELIVDQLSTIYPYIYPDPLDGLTSAYDTMIFSRYPITNATSYQFEGTIMGRNIKLVIVTDNDSNKYYICTTHFESEFKDGCTKKIYQYNRCADILHQLYHKTGIPVIMCADTNVCLISEQSFNDAFSYNKGWRDAWIEDGTSNADKITFDPNTNPLLIERYAGMDNSLKQRFVSRLDRIIHLSNMHVIDFKMFGSPNSENFMNREKILSDHYGIVCTITDKKPEFRDDYVPHTNISKFKAGKKSTKKLF